MSDAVDSPTPEDDARQKQLDAYRCVLASAAQSTQSEYDKAVMALSGGALGISFTLLRDVLGTKALASFGFLFWAWMLWIISISSIFVSFYTSIKACNRALSDTDNGLVDKTNAQSGWAKVTAILNVSAGICFLTGVVFLAIFVACNQPSPTTSSRSSPSSHKSEPSASQPQLRPVTK